MRLSLSVREIYSDLTEIIMTTRRKLCFTREILDRCKERVSNGESKRSVARELGVNEATLRKRLREVSKHTVSASTTTAKWGDIEHMGKN